MDAHDIFVSYASLELEVTDLHNWHAGEPLFDAVMPYSDCIGACADMCSAKTCAQWRMLGVTCAHFRAGFGECLRSDNTSPCDDCCAETAVARPPPPSQPAPPPQPSAPLAASCSNPCFDTTCAFFRNEPCSVTQSFAQSGDFAGCNCQGCCLT